MQPFPRIGCRLITSMFRFTNTLATYNMQSFFVTLFLLAICVCCQPADLSTKDKPVAQTFQKARLWNNGLPADGCDYRISLYTSGAWVDYAPDAASRELIEKFALTNLTFTNDYHGYEEIRVKASPTGKQASVTCGWGAKRNLAEITVSDIRK